MKKGKIVAEIVIAIIGVLLVEFGLICFNKYVLMSLPLVARMILMIVMYWMIALVPIIFCLKNKCKLNDLGFTKNNLGKQIIIGIIIALIASAVFTLIPMLIFGKENTYSGSNFKYLWQYIYQFVYLTIGVSLTEEFIFRGYLLNNLKSISKNSIIPVIVTSLVFGIFHVFNGNIIQVIMTSFLGLVFVLCREKIKNCSLLSLIIAHGLYDWLIVVLTAIL